MLLLLLLLLLLLPGFSVLVGVRACVRVCVGHVARSSLGAAQCGALWCCS
jgi:hypothetical protein